MNMPNTMPPYFSQLMVFSVWLKTQERYIGGQKNFFLTPIYGILQNQKQWRFMTKPSPLYRSLLIRQPYPSINGFPFATMCQSENLMICSKSTEAINLALMTIIASMVQS